MSSHDDAGKSSAGGRIQSHFLPRRAAWTSKHLPKDPKEGSWIACRSSRPHAGVERVAASATSRGLFIHRPTRDPFVRAPRAWVAEPASGNGEWRKAVAVGVEWAANLMIRRQIVIFEPAAAGAPAESARLGQLPMLDGLERDAIS